MKKMDEMDRNIQLHSEEWGYNPLPSLILCFAVSVQAFSQIAMKQKMVAGDEEYQEPNKLLRTVIATIVLVVLILSVGTYFLVRV